MRSFSLLASPSWCLLAVLSVGCAHSGASSSSAPASAEAPASPEPSASKEQKVRKLMALTGAEDVGQQMLDTMTRQFEQMPDIPPSFMRKFREFAAEDSIVDLLVPVYMRHFSEEDLDAAIAFHESPSGRRFIAAQPAVLREATEIGEQWGIRVAEKTLRALIQEKQERVPVRDEGQQL